MRHILSHCIWILLVLLITGCADTSTFMTKPIVLQPCIVEGRTSADASFKTIRYVVTNMRGFAIKQVDETKRSMSFEVCGNNRGFCALLAVDTDQAGVISISKDPSVVFNKDNANRLAGWMSDVQRNFDRNRCKKTFLEEGNGVSP